MSEYEPDDELHVEIEDLPGPAAPSGVRFALRLPLFSQGTPHRRGAHLLLAFGCLALAATLILASIPGARDSASALVRAFLPAPATPAPAYASRFYLLPNPPAVTVSLDGRALTLLPLYGDAHPLVLAPGRHTFTWTSRWFPFQPQTCVVTVPARSQRSAGSCPLDLLAPPDIVGQPQPRGYVISLHLSLASLPQTEMRALLAAIYGALATPFTTTVQIGEQYALDTSTIRARVATATEPLQATLRYTFPPDSFYVEPCLPIGIILPCRFPGQDCGVICTAPPVLAAHVGGDARGWIAGVAVHAAWTYTTQSGAIVARDVLDPLSALVMLRITWDGARWRVAPILGHNAALPAADDAACDGPLSQLANTASWSFIVTSPPPGAQLAVVSDASPADGCVLVVLGHGDPAPLFLGRFGLLFTVNDTAQNPTDNLPVASAAEQAFAQRLAAVYLHPSR